MTGRAAILEQIGNALSRCGELLRDMAAQEEAQAEAGERLLSVREVAGQLGVGMTTARALVREKKIASVRVGRLVRVPQSGITSYAQRRRTA